MATAGSNAGKSVAGDEAAALLATILPDHAHVLDFSCGDVRHVAGLTDRGYCVTGAGSGTDLLGLDVSLPGARIDAAICLQPPPWRDDADIMRLLRSVRAKLADTGLLVLADGRAPSTDLRVLVRASGFDVVSSPNPAWILAIVAPSAPDALAVQLYHAGSPAGLDLRGSPDEADFLRPAPEKIWAPLLHGDVAKVSCSYVLDDPWGGSRGAPVVSSYFGAPLGPADVVFGAGATGLLRQLAPLARAGRLLTTRFVHRDFPLWAMAEGARIRWVGEAQDEQEVEAAIADFAPHVVALDRPAATGAVIAVSKLERICEDARRARGIVIVDESYHSYLAGFGSAICLVPACSNLIVIRSLSKGYCAGGLRVGFAVGGALASGALRRLVAPLQVSELAFQLGLRLLGAGDIFVHLRQRIAVAKCEMIEVLTGSGYPIIAGERELPWVLIDDRSGQVHNQFAARGITAKRLRPLDRNSDEAFLRLAVPLSAERMLRFRRAMEAEA